jgi:hypothetical protein
VERVWLIGYCLAMANYVYLLASQRRRTIYIGVSNNLALRAPVYSEKNDPRNRANSNLNRPRVGSFKEKSSDEVLIFL